MPFEPEHLLIIISDNRGEQDYIKSMATLVKDEVASSDNQLTYSVFKQVKTDDGVYRLLQLTDLPSTSNELTALVKTGTPVSPEEIAYHVKQRGDKHRNGKHRIIASGNNTLNQAVLLQNTIAVVTNAVSPISYITHRLNQQDKSTLFGHWVEFITPQPKEDIAALFDLDIDLVQHRHIDLSEVPHSYTLENCRDAWEIFQEHAAENDFAAQIVKQITTGQKLALTVLPAGFANMDLDDMGRHVPYQEYEAYRAGNSIGRYLPSDTMMAITEGGPRNRKDYEAGQNTLRSYAVGYRHGQQGLAPNANPVIVTEPFMSGMAYDTTKVFIALASLYPDQITALFIAGEANGMRSAVLQHIDLERVTSGMLMSNVLVRRGDNLQPDQAAGLPVIDFQYGDIVFDYGDAQEKAAKRRNPARAVMDALGFGKD